MHPLPGLSLLRAVPFPLPRLAVRGPDPLFYLKERDRAERYPREKSARSSIYSILLFVLGWKYCGEEPLKRFLKIKVSFLSDDGPGSFRRERNKSRLTSGCDPHSSVLVNCLRSALEPVEALWVSFRARFAAVRQKLNHM